MHISGFPPFEADWSPENRLSKVNRVKIRKREKHKGEEHSFQTTGAYGAEKLGSDFGFL